MPVEHGNGFSMFHSTEVQKIFSGETPYQKCMTCDGSGYQNWDGDGTDVKPGRSESDDRENGACESCLGAGIVPGISLTQQGVREVSEDTPDATPRFRGPVESGRNHFGKKITGVAIRSEDLVVHSLPPPYRHDAVISMMVGEKGYSRPVTGEQGFVLEDGMFLDRVQSWRVAKHANQILPGKGGHRELYSEDLW